MGVAKLGEGGVEHGDVVAAVLLPAFPRRSTATRNASVLLQDASIGWYSKVSLTVGTACSFSL
ncbi:hypothetical protein ABT341_23740 [Pseudonocardia alni]|uniref:hypothetical protein n=1 Tax=Pseudonocardia alni TaxID=33907 RepID=UPI0033302FC4